MKAIQLTVTLGLVLVAVPQVKGGANYNAVTDFSLSGNPNGQWSYLYDPGSGPQLFTHPVVNYAEPGVDAWWNGLSVPNSSATFKNTTGQTIYLYGGGVTLTPSMLCMDPVINKSDITRWTAPSAGTWSISGLFQGIDINEHSHTVEILDDSTTMLLAPTSINSYGQTVTFSATVSLAAGDTIDFMVNGATVYTSLSTGFSATIQLSSVPEPSSFVLGIIASLTCGASYWRPRRLRREKRVRPIWSKAL
jgi:hypothetical protein